MARYFKVLDEYNRSCYGGDADLAWSLPVQNEDGSWTPGAWMPEVEGKLELCRRGYHLAREQDLLKWLNASIYEAEPSAEMIEGEDKVVCRSVRLLRKMAWDKQTAVLFACDCAERVLHVFEKQYPDDKRPRTAIETARKWARGEATLKETRSASDAAAAAAGASYSAACADDTVSYAASDAAGSAYAASDASDDTADVAYSTYAASGAATHAADAADASEREWQLKRLMEYLEGKNEGRRNDRRRTQGVSRRS